MRRRILISISALALAAGAFGAVAQSGGAAGTGASGTTGGTSGSTSSPGTAPSGARSSFSVPNSSGPNGTGMQTGPGTTAQTSPLGGTGSPSRLGQPGRTLGQPTTGMNAPAPGAGRIDQGESNQLPEVQRDRSNPLQAAPKLPEFQGSGGKAKDGSIPGGSLVALTAEERRKIRDIIVSQTAAQEPRANFKLMIGAKVPENVSLRPMPQEAVNVVPKYRDFDFTIVNDRIVVVQRSTREIDTMIPI